jgi:hypothetical protein
MRYMLLICADEKTEAVVPPAEMSAIVQGHRRFAEELRAAGKMVAGERLRPTPASARSSPRGWRPARRRDASARSGERPRRSEAGRRRRG